MAMGMGMGMVKVRFRANMLDSVEGKSGCGSHGWSSAICSQQAIPFTIHKIKGTSIIKLTMSR